VLLFQHENIIRVSLEQDNDLIVHEWLEYNPENGDSVIHEILDQIYKTFLQHDVTKVLVIADKTKGAFSPDIQTFINDVQFPRLIEETKIKYVATVVSENVFNRLGAKLWQDQLAAGERMIMREVLSADEGRAWLKQVDQ